MDLGCGTGNLIAAIRHNGAVITGVDGSASMLKVAQHKLGNGQQVTLVRQDVRAYVARAADKTYDKIVMVNVLYALDNRSQFWSDVLRILKPGGRIIVTTSERPGSRAIIREHLQNDSWRRLVSPKLAGVMLIDALINLLGKSRHFPFANRRELQAEIEQSGGRFLDPETCYGGMNVLFGVEHTN